MGGLAGKHIFSILGLNITELQPQANPWDLYVIKEGHEIACTKTF